MARDAHRPDGVILDPTPKEVFFDRRRFMQLAAAGMATAPVACAQDPSVVTGSGADEDRVKPPIAWPEGMTRRVSDAHPLPEAIATVRREPSPRSQTGRYNNFYEFLPGGAGDVWPHTADFVVDPWSVAIGGACAKSTTLGLEDLFKIDHEERLYHFRCVETWAMNVPWMGFPLRKLLERVEPKSNAKYVKFVTANRPEQMPGVRASSYPWPYFEALRMDEAMHDLAMVVTGVYGEPLPKQHGAPIRIIVPWKYGYKSPKSVVKIELLEQRPQSFWSKLQPREYGFLSNVNPNIPHPRWSQAQSWWIGERRNRFPTPIFNGYGKQVASLYPDEPTTPQNPVPRGGVAR